MPDREKVIKALDEHLHCSGRGKSGYCPYSDDELWNDISDALALLQEQEPVNVDFLPDHAFGCPACGSVVNLLNPYCWNCGRRLLWDD